MDRRTFITAAAASAALGGLPSLAHAQTIVPRLSREHQALVDRAVDYLEGLSTAKGRFAQSNNKGQRSTGVLYLNRPGKARFEYDAPAMMVVVADGKDVSVYDGRLKTFDRYPLGATPLGIFLARRIRLDRQVVISGFSRRPDGFSITLKDARGGSNDSLIMDFTDGPMTLVGWTVVDGAARTDVRLTGLAPAGSLDQALFTLADPRRAG
jgi:outer membrane lipoprotein-sorting protein